MSQADTESSHEPRPQYAGARAVVNTDGTVNYVDENAIGGDMQDMPKGYFRSLPFLGTVLVRPRRYPQSVEELEWTRRSNTSPRRNV